MFSARKNGTSARNIPTYATWMTFVSLEALMLWLQVFEILTLTRLMKAKCTAIFTRMVFFFYTILCTDCICSSASYLCLVLPSAAIDAKFCNGEKRIYIAWLLAYIVEVFVIIHCPSNSTVKQTRLHVDGWGLRLNENHRRQP